MDRKELIDLMCKSQLTNQQFMDIYDEMRSRTCENCKYLTDSNLDNCKIFDLAMEVFLFADVGTYGCNEFVRK